MKRKIRSGTTTVPRGSPARSRTRSSAPSTASCPRHFFRASPETNARNLLEAMAPFRAMMKLKHYPGLIGGCLFCVAAACAADWPQYRGPNQDGISTEKLPLKAWPDSGLPQLWKAPTPTGFSSFTIGGGNVFTIVARDVESTKRETCVALDATS